MARLKLGPITGYQQLADVLGCRTGVQIGHNTRLVAFVDSIRVRLHDTDIITVTPDNVAVINSGGWQTVTTKDRLNALLSGFTISQKSHRWTLHSAGGSQPYEDGTRVNLRTGDIVGTGGYRPFTVPTIADPKVAAAVA